MKPNTNLFQCSSCEIGIVVDDDYDPDYCCDGRDCTCHGKETNPAFCAKCEQIIEETSPERKRKVGLKS